MPTEVRHVYVVLGTVSLPYAKICIGSMLDHSDEAIDLKVITDKDADRETYRAEFSDCATRNPRHQVSFYSEADLDAVAARRIGAFGAVQEFRKGHPCWRKITDPALLAADGEEAIVIDPDVYFPNRFKFEPTPERGLLLMWQRPNCMLPPEAVRKALGLCALADHVDIGVGQVRCPVDWEWLDSFLRALQPQPYKKFMHIEVVVWSAMAMRIGGGYLNPGHWRCYRNSLAKRLRLRLGTDRMRLLAAEKLREVKAFHAGGYPKYWLAEAVERNVLPEPGVVLHSLPTVPYRAYSNARHEWKLTTRDAARRLGIFRLLSSQQP